MLTFPQFQATRRAIDDVREEFGTSGFEEPGPLPAYVYADSCYVERRPDQQFYLQLSNDDWGSPDLTKLERILWSLHYLSEAIEPGEACLRVDDGTLDDFVVGWCDARRRPVDGDLFGVLFSGADSWSLSDAQDALRNSFRSIDTGEVMIFARGRWEFATQEKNLVDGRQQWVRRDQSFICYDGAETATMPIPSWPVQTRRHP